MTPIRPNAFATPPAPSSGADAARQAAQRAFFDAAMGRAAQPASTPTAQAAQVPRMSAAVAASAAPARVDLRPDPGADPPARLLRPGSLLDIRV